VQGREDYKRDEHGNPVRTRVNEEFLIQLAEAGNGTMYRINDSGIIGDIKSQIDKFDKRAMAEKAFKDFESYYQYFLFGGIGLIALSWVIGELRRTRPTLTRSFR
jgi:Ca-activated chloride channel family protein